MRRFWPGMVFALGVAASAGVGIMLDDAARARADRAARAEVRAIADAVRLRLEIRINANLQIAEGLATYVAANPDLRLGDFAKLAGNLMRHRSEVRNIALARDTRIIAVYPLEGNEPVIGVDYRTVPDQWEGVRWVKEMGEPIIVGPVDLIQGGRAIIGRVPVFASSGWQDDPQGFWGLVSVPIEVGALFAHAGLTDTLPLDIALRGVNGQGADGAVFEGETELFLLRRPELFTVSLPGGTWQMAAVPKGGWPSETSGPGPAMALALFAGVVLGGFGAAGTVALGRRGASAEPARGPARYQTRDAFAAHLDDEVRARRMHGRAMVLLGFDLPPGSAGTPSPDTCLDACAQAVSRHDMLGPLAARRYAVVLGGAAEQGATLATDFLRRALAGIEVDAEAVRFATVSMGPEDTDGAAILGRLEALLDEIRSQPGMRLST